MDISVYYPGDSEIKARLRDRLTAYSLRLMNDPWEPSIKISMDELTAQLIKFVDMASTSADLITFSKRQRFKTFSELCDYIIILISLTRQRVLEKDELQSGDFLYISIIPLKPGDESCFDFEIQWVTGKQTRFA